MDSSLKLTVNYHKIIYFVLIFGAIFMDCPTGIYFGIIGRCWLFMFVPVCFALLSLKGIHIQRNAYIESLIFLTAWVLVISIITSVLQVTGLGIVEYRGENVWIKSLKTSAYWVVLVMYLICILDCIKNMTKKEILFPFLVAYIFLFVVLILELYQMPYAFENLHFNAFLGRYERVRLTTTESSTTIPLIVCYGLFSLYYAFYISNSKILKITVLAMLFIFNITSGSKTLLLMYLIGIVGFIWVNRKNTTKNFAILMIVFVVASIFFIPKLMGLLGTKMMDMGGSTATRGIQLIAAMMHSVKYPIGNGGGAYIYTYEENLVHAYDLIRSSFIGNKLNYWEILAQINGKSDDSLGVIAGAWQLALYVGLLGIVYWLFSTWKYLSTLFRSMCKGNWIIKIICLCIVFMWLFTTTMYNVYYMWAAILIAGLDVLAVED